MPPIAPPAKITDRGQQRANSSIFSARTAVRGTITAMKDSPIPGDNQVREIAKADGAKRLWPSTNAQDVDVSASTSRLPRSGRSSAVTRAGATGGATRKAAVKNSRLHASRICLTKITRSSRMAFGEPVRAKRSSLPKELRFELKTDA